MTHSGVTWLLHVWHDSFTYNMTHSHMTWLNHMWHDSFMCDVTLCVYVKWLIHMCDMTLYMWRAAPRLVCALELRRFANSTRPTVMFAMTRLSCDMTHSSYVTWCIHMSGVTPSHVWHDSFTCVTWLVHMLTWLLPHSYDDAPRCHVTYGVATVSRIDKIIRI